MKFWWVSLPWLLLCLSTRLIVKRAGYFRLIQHYCSARENKPEKVKISKKQTNRQNNQPCKETSIIFHLGFLHIFPQWAYFIWPRCDRKWLCMQLQRYSAQRPGTVAVGSYYCGPKALCSWWWSITCQTAAKLEWHSFPEADHDDLTCFFFER